MVKTKARRKDGTWKQGLEDEELDRDDGCPHVRGRSVTAQVGVGVECSNVPLLPRQNNYT
jgi:hypothetical protein